MNRYVKEYPRREEAILIREIEETLYALKWPTKRPHKDRTRNYVLSHSQQEIHAFALGRVRRYDLPYELVESQYNKKYADLYRLLRKLVRVHNPNFKYNAIQINDGVKTAPHKDRNNAGPSYCFAIGKHTGGGLVFHDEHTGSPTETVPNRHIWVRYNGAKTLHSSAPVKSGRRFAIIFYTATPKSSHPHHPSSHKASRRESSLGKHIHSRGSN